MESAIKANLITALFVLCLVSCPFPSFCLQGACIAAGLLAINYTENFPVRWLSARDGALACILYQYGKCSIGGRHAEEPRGGLKAPRKKRILCSRGRLTSPCAGGCGSEKIFYEVYRRAKYQDTFELYREIPARKFCRSKDSAGTKKKKKEAKRARLSKSYSKSGQKKKVAEGATRVTPLSVLSHSFPLLF